MSHRRGPAVNRAPSRLHWLGNIERHHPDTLPAARHLAENNDATIPVELQAQIKTLIARGYLRVVAGQHLKRALPRHKEGGTQSRDLSNSTA
jgi:hypothetical protein